MDDEKSLEEPQHTLILYIDQVSGKSPKFVSKDNSKIYKGLIDQQLQFFESIYNYHTTQNGYQIRKYLPQFLGKTTINTQPFFLQASSTEDEGLAIWLKHIFTRQEERNPQNSFLILKNLTYGIKATNILDIKIGGRSEKKHKITQAVREFKLKLNGMRKNNYKDKDWFRSKYILQKIIESRKIREALAFFFHDGQQIDKLLMEDMISKLKDLLLSLRCLEGWKFSSSSILFIYDFENKKNNTVKFIDFGRARREENLRYDSETCQGIQNIIKFLCEIVENTQTYHHIELDSFQMEEVVPEKKRKQYQKCK